MGGDEEPGPGVGAGDGLAIRERDRRLKQKAVTQGQIKVGTTGDTQVTQKRKEYGSHTDIFCPDFLEEVQSS